jgi:hypothetical protein
MRNLQNPKNKPHLRNSGDADLDARRPVASEVPAIADDRKEAVTSSASEVVPTAIEPAGKKDLCIATEQGPPTDLLLELQLREVGPNVHLSSTEAIKVVNDDVRALYGALSPQNILESLLARQLTALNSVSMELFRNALRSAGDRDAMETFVRLGCKASSTITATVEAYRKLKRDDRQGSQINNVNFEAGAQAIVGRIEVGNGDKGTRAQNPITMRLANDIEEAA